MDYKKIAGISEESITDGRESKSSALEFHGNLSGRPEAYVAGVMDRDYLAVEPAADLAEMLPLMARGCCALVQDGDRLVGLLTTDNLSEFLLLRGFGIEPVI